MIPGRVSVVLFLAYMTWVFPAQAQQRMGREDIVAPSGAVIVRVRAAGTPLSGGAIVRLYSLTKAINLTESTKDMGQTTFNSVPLGNYQLEVSASGFLPYSEEVSLMGVATTLYVEMRAESVVGSKPSDRLVLAPKAEKELSKAVQAIQQKDFKNAEERLQKVIKMAPSHPDAYYLLAMIRLEQKQNAEAEEQLKKALQLFPDHDPSLISLSQILLMRRDYPTAVKNLERALVLNPDSWNAHELVAVAYLELNDYEKARNHAARALELSHGKSPNLYFILGSAYVGLGEQAKAQAALQKFVELRPDSPSAVQARRVLGSLESKQEPGSKSLGTQTESDPAATAASFPITREIVPPPRRWPLIPVDQFKPDITPGVACSLPEVLQGVGKRMKEVADNLGKITATEVIEAVGYDSLGNRRYSDPWRFYYTVEIREPRKGILSVEEYRQAVNSLQGSPAGPLTRGLMALGMIFHSYYIKDYDVRCEGLTEWRGQPAWSVYFQQRADRPSQVRTYVTAQGSFPIPLKGRAWITAKTFELVRLETNLVEANRSMQLEHEHIWVEYRPVFFEQRKTQLWLPTTAEILTSLKGQMYHSRHTLRDYLLFVVDVEEKFGKPKEVPPPEEPQKPPTARE